MKQVRLIISGRVQGVFYRAAIRDLAANYAVTGYVKNCADGTVEVLAEGEETELQKFASECKINDGVREAEGVESEWSDLPSREHGSFSISY